MRLKDHVVFFLLMCLAITARTSAVNLTAEPAGSGPYLIGKKDLELVLWWRVAMAEQKLLNGQTDLEGRTLAIFDAAKLRYIIRPLALKRAATLLRTSKTPVCASAYFKTPERLRLFKFSDPISNPRGMVVVVHKDHALAQNPVKTIKALFQTHYIFARSNDISFGGQVDTAFEKYTPPTFPSVLRYTSINAVAVQKDADYTILARDEFEGLADVTKLYPVLTAFQLEDAKFLPTTHIICSQSTPDSMVNRINASIAEVLGDILRQ